jgi:hypothetical protein
MRSTATATRFAMVEMKAYDVAVVGLGAMGSAGTESRGAGTTSSSPFVPRCNSGIGPPPGGNCCMAPGKIPPTLIATIIAANRSLLRTRHPRSFNAPSLRPVNERL